MQKKPLPTQPSLVKNKTIILALDQVLKPLRKDTEKKWIKLKWLASGTFVFGLAFAGFTTFGWMDSQPNNLQSEALSIEISNQGRKPASNPPIQNTVAKLESSQSEPKPIPEFIEYPVNLTDSLSSVHNQNEYDNLDQLQNDQLSHAQEQYPEDHTTEEVYESY